MFVCEGDKAGCGCGGMVVTIDDADVVAVDGGMVMTGYTERLWVVEVTVDKSDDGGGGGSSGCCNCNGVECCCGVGSGGVGSGIPSGLPVVSNGGTPL